MEQAYFIVIKKHVKDEKSDNTLAFPQIFSAIAWLLL